MTLYERIAGFPLKIESYSLETIDRDQLGGRTRVTTLVSLHGDSVVGRGEDVIYDKADHRALIDAEAETDGSLFALAGEYTTDEFSEIGRAHV